MTAARGDYAGGERPTMTRDTYSNKTYKSEDAAAAMNMLRYARAAAPQTLTELQQQHARIEPQQMRQMLAAGDWPPNQEQKTMAQQKTPRRMVRVIIIDTDENIPLDKCVLHSGSEQITDLEDTELLFDIPVKSLLDSHNEYRVTVQNRRVKDRVENLQPARIRDLTMSVVEIAKFG